MNRISIGYVRNSRITQENSIFTQESLIKDYCKKWDEVLTSIYYENGSWDKRTGYKSWEIKEL